MYRIIFEHCPKPDQEVQFIAQWQWGSDIIQTYPGARGSKLFRMNGNPGRIYAMAEWDSKEARAAAVERIRRERTDADLVLRGHEKYLESHVTLGEFDCVAESHPPIN